MTLTKEFISERALRKAMDPESQKKFDQREVRLSAIGTCNKKQVLGALEGMDPIAWEYSQGGHILQKALADILVHQGHLVQEEVAVKHPFGQAHIDIIVDDKHIIECKTIKCSGFQYDLPKLNNVLQTKGQMIFLEDEIKVQPTAELIYMCRDHMGEHFKAFEVPFPTMAERLQIMQQLQQVAAAIANNYTPEKPFDKPQWECGWKVREGGEIKEIRCPFWDRCWESEPAKPETPVRVVETAEDQALIKTYAGVIKKIADLKIAKDAMEENMVTQFGDFQKIAAGPYTVNRAVKKRTSVNYEKFLEVSGTMPSEEQLQPFTKVSEYESFSLKESKNAN
jgi:hypothetical protein